jgi:hypothetical protein
LIQKEWEIGLFELFLFPDSDKNAIPTAIKKIPNAMPRYNIVVSF